MSEKNSKPIIYYNGTILTMNDDHFVVDAIAVVGEKIAAIGGLDEVKEKVGNEYELIDLKGKTMLPGFIDCHLHPILYTFYYIFPNLANINSLSELKSILSNAAKNWPTDKLLVGLNLCEENFDTPILPTRWDLDDACPNHPVFVMRYDGHVGIANTKALKLAGIDENTPSPEGGEIRKDEKGKLTGILSENAMAPMLSKISLPEKAELEKGAEKVFQKLAENGITSIHGILHAESGGEFGDMGAIEIPFLRTVIDKVLQNWYLIIFTNRLRKLLKLKKPPLDEGKHDGKFKIGCLKLFLDGTFGAKTAYMFEPFSDFPESSGFCVVEPEELYKQMKKAHEKGIQIAVHVIGDKGNRLIVDLFKRLLEEVPRPDHRHRIEHASMLTKDVLEDMAKLGIIASCQPPFINSEYTWLEKRIGKERCKYTYPMKSIIEAGVVLVSGSDCPVEDPSVILGLHALVNRNGFVPEECISMKEALKTYTINAAYAAFEEDIKGTIDVGKLADLVILNKNPLEISKENIKELKIVETIIRGKTVYRSS
ncbi:MAG: amidohydrolase [Promethearchaeota archaeon]